MSNSEIMAILLAAGGSKRLGRPKQLLSYKGRPLIEHSIQLLRDTGLPITVVVGGFGTEVVPHIPKDCTILENPDWERGLSTSLRLAVDRFGSDYRAFLFSTVDQPLVTGRHLRTLVSKFMESDRQLVATHYDGIDGVPAVVGKAYFTRLTKLIGDTGAKEILKNHPDDLVGIPFEGASLDIDTKEDLKKIN